MKLSLLILMLMGIGWVPGHPDCRCKKASDAETTNWGNDPVQYSGVDLVKRIKGRVTDANGEALADALVEVFDKPTEEIYVYHLDSRNRVAACKTAKNGTFCLTGLVPKQYVVCASARHGELKASCRSIRLVPRGVRRPNKVLSFELENSI